MRNMLIDYKRIGDDLWARFNAPKHMQAWYYSKLTDGLCEMQNYPETADVYWEMTALYKDLFVTYYVDENKGLLYQISDSGESVVLKKGKPRWIPATSNPSKKARQINRKEAERIEDSWAEPFWAVHELDLSDAVYEIYKTDDQYLFIDIKDGELALHAEYFSDHYNCDTHYFLNPDSAHRLLVQLRLKHGIRNKLSTIFKNEFGTSDGAIKFKEYCDEIGVEVHVTAIS